MGHRWPPMQVGMWIQWKAMNWNRAVSSVSSFSIPSLSINQSYQNLTWGILRLVLPPWIVSKDHESKTMIVALEHKLHRSLGLSPGVPINPCWDACQRKWLWTKLVYYRKYWRSCNLWYSEFQMYASQRFYETSGLDSGTWGWTGSSFFLMNSQNGTSWQPGVFTPGPHGKCTCKRLLEGPWLIQLEAQDWIVKMQKFSVTVLLVIIAELHGVWLWQRAETISLGVQVSTWKPVKPDVRLYSATMWQ